MKICRTLLLAAGLGFANFGLMAPPATALPMMGLDPAFATQAAAAQTVEKARWICGPYGGCRWVHGWRHWGPRRYWASHYGPWWWWPRPFYW